jgi:GT2 family glycosyltransferase
MPTNGGISSASNVSLKMAKGEYIALVDQDDEITHDAFFWFVREINLHPDADFLYSDECKIGESLTINPTCFYLKPNWSPELLINHMYTGHLTMYRTELVRSIGGFRSEYDFSQDYDLALRMSDVTEHIYHIERVLYFWRMIPSSAAAGGKDYARISNIAAVHDWYKRHNLHTLQEYRPYANYGSLVMEENPLVSIIIPTDSIKMLKNCIQGLVSDTSYKNIELIPVTNSKTAEEIIEECSYLTILKVCCYDKLYNFSDKCNMGVNMASGKYVVIYNDDVYPSTRDWIERMLEILKYPKVGGVSPLLLHEDGTIQYAGMITGTPGLVGTSFNNMPLLLKEPNPYCHFLLRDVSILSGACMMMDREVFQRIKGFDPVNTPAGHSDVDISFRIQEQGLRCVFTPYAVLIHKGNHSWETTDRMDKADVYCLKRWGKYIAADYYFTKSMRKMYYHDFRGEYEIYMPEKTISNMPYRKDILFITHELSLTGAPIVLCEAVKVSLKNGDYPVVMCPQDGPLRKKYLDMGVIVIIDEVALNNGDMFRRFAHNFDLVVVNTIACYWAIQYLSNYLPPVLWWIHEGTTATQIFIDHLPKKIGNNIFPYYVCNYTKKVMEKHRLYKSSGLLIYGIEDAAMGVMTKYNQNNKVKFLTVGSIEHRKGQDILLEAIKRLPKEYQDKQNFYLLVKHLMII